MSSITSHSLWDLVSLKMLMKVPEYDLYAPNRGDTLEAYYQKRASIKLVCTRLSIRGIVHWSAVDKVQPLVYST
jgi:hypothetical protein